MNNLVLTTSLTHLKKNSYTIKLNIWVLHDLIEKNLMNCIFICDFLFKSYETDLFLKTLFYGTRAQLAIGLPDEKHLIFGW